MATERKVPGQKIVAIEVATGKKRKFNSQGQAAKELNVLQTNISKILLKNEQLRLKTTHGYSFELDEAYKRDQQSLPGEKWRAISQDLATAAGLTANMVKGMRVSTMGRVEDKKKRRSFGSDEDSYKVVRVSNGPTRKKARVHILCALAFVGPKPSEDYLVKHINDEMDDNRAENLVWVHRTAPSDRIGTNKAVQKLDVDTGRVLDTYSSAKEAADRNGIKHMNQISNAIAGRKTTAGGFKWRFENRT
jgi:hypothetical protein